MIPHQPALALPCCLFLQAVVTWFLLESLHDRSCHAGDPVDRRPVMVVGQDIWHSPGDSAGDAIYQDELANLLEPPPRHVSELVAPAARLRIPDSILHRRSMVECCRAASFVKQDIVCDFRNFFDKRNVVEFGVALGVAASFANTSLDEDFRQWIDRQGLSSRSTDCWYDEFGNGSYVIPLTIGTSLAAHLWRVRHPDRHSPVAESLNTWGYRSARSIGVGTPALILTQWSTGGSRPGETAFGSEWKWFDDDNGASGHAFIGAIPFLVAADMTDRPVLKGMLYLGSGLAGYGRICNDSHYLSQVILGWTIAHISVRATRITDSRRPPYSVTPLAINGDPGIGIVIRR